MLRSLPYLLPSDNGKSERILFIRYSALGDILLATPYARALKEKFPDCHLTWLAACPYEQLLEGQPYIDGILQWDRSLDNGAFFRLIREIRKKRFTRIVSLQGTDRGALMALLSGVPQRFCESGKWMPVYNPGTSDFWKTHDIKAPETPGKGYAATKKMLDCASALLDPVKQPFVLAAIGASKEVKQWPVSRWAEFVKEACAREIPVVLAGDGVEERRKSEEIVKASPSPFLHNLVGRIPLFALGGAVTKAALVIAGDTGILNMARIMGVPSIALLGPTPLPGGVGLMKPEQVFVSECGKAGCGKTDCRENCLESIESAEVFRAVRRVWNRTSIGNSTQNGS